MKNTSTNIAAGVICLVGIAWFLFFYTLYPYHQYHKEQTTLFLLSTDALSAYAGQPALIACLAGDFLTQFYYFATGAPLILALIAVSTGWLSYLILRPWLPHGLALGAACLVMSWEMLRTSALVYPSASSLSLIGGLGLFLLYRAVKNRKIRALTGLAAALAGYYLLGYGIILFAMLALLQAWVEKKGYPESVLLLVIVLIIPAWAGPQQGLPPAQAYPYPATGWWDTPDLSHERLLGMDTEASSGNWKKVTQLAQGAPDVQAATYYYNLANAVHGRLPEGLMHPGAPNIQGLFLPVTSQSSYLSTLFAGEGWFQLGDMTMAEHATLLGMIFSPDHHGTRMLKRLAEINLINGDEAAAMKYLRILSKTLFYRQWARDRMPGRESQEVRQWLATKRALIPQTDTLRTSTTDIVKSLRHLLRANPENLPARDYLLCFHLLTKNIPGFLEDYVPTPGQAPKRLYAEALLIDLVRRKAPADEIRNTIVDPRIMEDFKAYNLLHRQSGGNPSALAARFGKTYWFYFHYAQLQN